MHSIARPDRLVNRVLVALTTLVLALGLSACGEKKEDVAKEELKQDRLVLMLDWTPNADHAGIYSGLIDGSFKKLGVDLEPQVPSANVDVIKQVAAGRVDLGITYQPYVMSARDQGVKVRAIASIIPKPLNSIMWLKKSGIKSVADLKGKTVGTAGGDNESAYLSTLLKKQGLDPKSVKVVNVGYDLTKVLLSGRVDAVVGVYKNIEGEALKARNRPATALTVDQAGIPPYNELVVIASEDSLNDGRRAELYRRFLAGLARGTENVMKVSNGAVHALEEADEELAKDPKLLAAQVKATLPFLRHDKDPFGFMDPTLWEDYANFMRDNGLLKNAPDASAAFTNDLLPGQGPNGATE